MNSKIKVEPMVQDGRQPLLMSIHDVAQALNCSARHIARLEQLGRIPRSIKLGASRRWSRLAIEKWIASETSQPRNAAKAGR